MTDPITRACEAWWKRCMATRRFLERLDILKPLGKRQDLNYGGVYDGRGNLVGSYDGAKITMFKRKK